MKKIITLRDEVKEIMINFPNTRDSDEALYCRYLQEKYGIIAKECTFYMVMNMQFRNEIPKQESVERCRRWIQEHFEELRGKSYEARQEEQEEYKEMVKNG